VRRRESVSSRRHAFALALVLFGCAANDGAPSGQGATGGTSSTGSAGASGSSGGRENVGAGGTAGAAGYVGAGGSVGVNGSGGVSGTGAAGTAAGGASSAGGTSRAGGTSSAGGTSGAGGSSAGRGGNGGNGGTAGRAGAGGVTAAGGAAGSGGSAGSQGPQAFHCVNWADARDNFVDGNLQLSGLSSATDTYATVQAKAGDILAEFQTKLNANSIRIPINEPTVSGAWWGAYKAVIDTAVAKGMKVVIAYWAHQNGKPDDAAAFKKMWQVVVSAYQGESLVYFDIHNEPYGYGTAWNDAAAQWLTDFSGVPRGRVIVAGTGYDDNVNSVGADSRFAGCILQLHIYGFWHDTWTAQRQWRDSMTSALGTHAARTLVGEWGAPMTTGTDYGVTTDGEAYRSYVLAVSNVMHDSGMGSCYWPGLRNGDSYSMTRLSSGGPPLTLTVANASGLARLHWAWQMP
jgi:hypothetical protein